MIRPSRPDVEPIPNTTPTLLYVDADLVVLDKPPGFLTHPDGAEDRPSALAFAQATLGQALEVVSRLDVDTSGVLPFARNPAGRARLKGAVKGYLAVVDGAPPSREGQLEGPVPQAPGRHALTRYRVRQASGGVSVVEAEPVTGRTHQIRAHLAAAGCPIRGDGRYGDPLDRRAPRALLHAHTLTLKDGARFSAPPPPDLARYLEPDDPQRARAGLAADPLTTCYREINGAADGQPHLLVDRYGDWLWVQRNGAGPLPALTHAGRFVLDAAVDRSHAAQAPPQLEGAPPPQPLEVYEHGTAYLVELGSALSTGLFLDQRPQRAWLASHASGLRVLNTFAHAGGFSVAAARAGAETVSVDLSGRWLARIPAQLEHLGLPTAPHRTLKGDVFDWLRRLARRGERFDLVILDPPSTSVGQRKRRWSAARDYPELVALALPLVAPGGRLWTATNLSKLSPLAFARKVASALPEGAYLERVCPPAVDFPVEKAAFSVKTHVWRLR
ncbi:class I SAM-dependent methyltransferase [Myxococcota bacterium]|nr:class I SAM-dependent methyltransferase [Myxococcota bacterium]